MPTKTPERVQRLRGLLQEKRTNITNLSNAWTDEGDGLVVSGQQQKDYLAAVEDAQSVYETLQAEEKAAGIFDYLDGVEHGSQGGSDAGDGQRSGVQTKSLSEAFFDSDEYAEMKASGFRRFGQTVMVESGLHDLARAAERKDVFSAMGGEHTIPGLGRSQNLGLTERVLRPGRVRDLFPAERTNAATLYGMRETGYTNRAATVPERTASDGSAATGGPTDVYGLKPKSELTIVPVKYDISTIAHIMYVHKNALDDEPRMRGLLERDMIDGVKMTEDEQILYGDGVGENLEGLVNVEGIQDYTGLATDKRSAQIRRAATRVLLAYFQPTGVVMHPFDWENVELETDANGAYTVAVSVAVGGEKRVWRLNVVDTPAAQAGKFIVGAWGTGAKLYDREQVSVQVSTENRDLFERNAVTLRAEERVGLVVDRPESFVHGTFTTPA